MAVLTRPLFHSQERIDLEDLNQLLSGLRTDARLWTRQVYADKNFIVKGFEVTGLGTDNLNVNLLDSTLLFAGRQDLQGAAQISVTGNVTAGTVITLTNTLGSNTVVLTEGTDWARSTTNTAQTAANLAAAINANGNFTASVTGSTISVVALISGYTTILAAPFDGFSADATGILSTFLYPTTLQESPADLSYFIIQSDATGAAARITRAISASERAAVGTASKTLFIYGTLVTEQNTPITKAFWDPSANSGAGAEFNQRVNTAVDLSINLLVSESKLNTDTEANAATFFANVPICEVEVDTSGIILSIRDTRPILFEADDTRVWNRTNAFATLTMANTTATPITGVNITNGLVPNSVGFAEGEIVQFTSLDATNIVAQATVQIGGTLNVDNATVLLDKFDLSTIGALQTIVTGVTSGAVRVVSLIDSNFLRDDKDIGDWRNAFSAMATEIRNVKGTQRWYEDPAATVKDILRFINSTIVGLEPNARYAWNASSAGADGTLDLRLDPLASLDLTVTAGNTIAATNTLTFTNTPANIVITAATTAPTAVLTLFNTTVSGLGTSTSVQDAVIGITITRSGSPRGDISTFSVTIASATGNVGFATALAAALNADGSDAFKADYAAAVNPGNTSQVFITARATGTDYNGTLAYTSSIGVISLTPTQQTAGVDGLGERVFLIGTDAEQTASHLASSINFNDGLSATFEESITTPGDYIINVGTSLSTITAFAFSGVAGALTPISATITPINPDSDLANVRFYGVDRQLTFRATSLIIAPNEVLFITVPDFDTDTSTSQIVYDNGDNSGNQFRYSSQGPGSTQGGAATWNATNRAIYENSNDVFKTTPISEFECNERNYWIAYRDNSATIYIRDVGELGTGESANIGHGISNATLAYIGAPSENISTPDYPAVDTINSFAADGAYLAGAANDFNNTLVAQSENLTSAINDINNHLTSIKDTQYQNLGIKLVDGGFFTWETSSGTLSWSAAAAVQLPGRPDTANSIATGSVTLATGEIAFVDINRNSTLSATLTPTAVAVDAFEPRRDRIVIARRINDFVFVGINGTIRLADSESAPLDSALQFIGLKNNELPKQLNTHISAALTGLAPQSIDVGTSDVLFPVGGLNTAGVFDDNITLSLSINSGILFWEGISIDFTNGRTYNEGTLVNFRGRTESDSTAFAAASIGNDQEVYYAISLTGETAITAVNRSTIDPGGANIPTTAIGRNAGEIDVAVGIPADIADGASLPEFGGDLPVAVIKVRRVGTVLQTFVAADLIVLGASGSGGGGTGDANQDLNNYLNRLNLSTFGYFTPIIAAISTSTDIDLTNTDAGLAASGFTIKAEQRLTTTTLLDPEFTDEGLIPERVEVEGIFGVDSAGLNIIDPNTRWFISFNSADAVPTSVSGVIAANGFTPITVSDTNTVAGWIDSAGALVGTNLTNITPSVANANIIFVENHGLSTGQKITFPTGFATISPAVPSGETLSAASVFYVHVRSADSFDLHNTQVLADGANVSSRLALSGTTFGAVTQNRAAGIIPRVGITNTLRGIFDTRNATLNGLAYTNTDGSIRSGALVRLALIGDPDADTRSQPDNALLTSFAAFYADELGVEGVNPNGLDDVNDILRSSHLVNATNANASYGVAGRGVVLLDTAGANKELSISSDDKLRIDGTELSTGHIIEDDAGNNLAEQANLQFIDNNVFNNPGNNRTIITPRRAHRGTSQLQSVLRRPVSNTGGEGANGIQETFSWTCPADVVEVYLEIVGGGSGGTTNPSNGGNGHGGGAGAYYQGWHTVVPGNSYVVRVGRAGGSTAQFNQGQRSGAASDFTGVIDGNIGASIISGGGTLTVVGVFSITGFSGDTPLTPGALTRGNNPHFIIRAAEWNITNRWKESGSTVQGGAGGSNYRAAGGGASTQGGAGGAGYVAGGGGSTGGGGAEGGSGGIRISWYSNISNGTTNPIT